MIRTLWHESPARGSYGPPTAGDETKSGRALAQRMRAGETSSPVGSEGRLSLGKHGLPGLPGSLKDLPELPLTFRRKLHTPTHGLVVCRSCLWDPIGRPPPFSTRHQLDRETVGPSHAKGEPALTGVKPMVSRRAFDLAVHRQIAYAQGRH